MTPAELRIGNLVYGKEIETVKAIGIEGYIWFDDKRNLLVEHCQPIQLTEEWLLKFGFKYKAEELGIKLYELQIGISFISLSIEGHFNINSGESYWYMDRDFKTPKYVHELQNLYFALTNEELTYKSE
jgi:hypothetical protein